MEKNLSFKQSWDEKVKNNFVAAGILDPQTWNNGNFMKNSEV